MLSKSVMIILISGALLLFGAAQGAVLRVEQDGSGDFTVIQAAIDAAADGDVIQIGSGRFEHSTNLPNFGDFRMLLYGDKNLTLLGAGDGSTIIGPSQYGGAYNDWGLYCYPGPVTIKIMGVRFENLDRSGVFLLCDNVELENCQFENCLQTCYLVDNQSGLISNCSFVNCTDNSSIGIDARVPSLRIIGCEFLNCAEGVRCDDPGATDILIENCNFDGENQGQIGVGFVDCGGRVTGCHFTRLTRVGFTCSWGSGVILQDNLFEGIVGNQYEGRAVALYGSGTFIAEGNIFSSSEVAFYLGNPFSEFSANNNHFFRDEGSENYFVKANLFWDYWEEHWDFTNNYWGTTDVDEISQWILDGNDTSETTVFVDFEPIAGGPVPTEKTTLDGLKALYR